ncbi:MAG: prepilin-type N-terminal cleavage/methylation domain-containing protein [Polyangiaceae bacterium]
MSNSVPLTPLTPLTLAKKVSRASSRGVSLVEVMIVVVIMGLIAGGVAAVAIPRLAEARIKTTQTNALELRKAAMTWHADHTDSCPTPQVLVKDKAIDATSKITDAWEMPYEIVCDEQADEITVVSPGPDKKKGTQDDIRVPAAAPQS